jgi:hypothetical protein
VVQESVNLEYFLLKMGTFRFKAAGQFVALHSSVVRCILNTEALISNAFCKFSNKEILMCFSVNLTKQLTDFWATLYIEASCCKR